MTKRHRTFRPTGPWPRALTGLALFGACSVVDKGDYTFTDEPGGDEGGGGGTTGGSGGNSGSSQGGKAGKGGTSGEAGEGVGGTAGTGGSGKGGTAGNPGGGEGGEGGACDPNPCAHSGRCTSTGSTFTCECTAGYEGVTCDDNIDDCDPNPCEQGAACTDEVADFTCACPALFTGKRCELPRFQPIRGPGMSPRVRARAVSTDGTVVLGSFQDMMGFEKPFIWEVGKAPTPLPLPSALRSDVNVTPHALSGNGAIWVGEVRATMGNPTPVGGDWTHSVMFGMPPNGFAGAAFDVSGDGTRAVGYASGMPGTPGRAPFAWVDRQMPMPLLNPMTGSMFASAGAITRDGSIVIGTAKDAMNNVFVVAWPEPGATPPGIRRTTGVTELEVHGVSDDGMHAVGTYVDTANANFAFVTQGSGIWNIAPPNGAVPAFSNAWDVSADGMVIVGDARIGMSGMESHAVMWKNDGAFVAKTIFDALRDNNVMPMGWTLTSAYGVSGNGKIIVGEGLNPMGQYEGFIVRLP